MKMRLSLLGLMTCLSVLVSGCVTPKVEVRTKVVHDEIPDALLEPVEVRARRVVGLQGVGEVLADAADALTTANCQLSGIDTIKRTTRGQELRNWDRWCPPAPTPQQ
jgi:hypothetical protein